MKIRNLFVSLLLSAAMILSIIPIAQAVGVTISADNVTADQNGNVSVPIKISGNTGICGAAITVSYSRSLTLVGVTEGSALSAMTMTKPGDLNANPIKLVWDATDACNENGVIAILNFKAPSAAGNYTVSIAYEDGDIVDDDLSPVDVSTQNGSVTVNGTQEIKTASLSVDNVQADVGASVNVPIRISENPGICGAKISITYSRNLTLIGIAEGSALSTMTMTKPGDLNANPVKLVWDATDACDENGVIAILNFRAPSAAGNYIISVSYENGDIVDGDLSPVDVSTQNGGIIVSETPETKTASISVDSIHTTAGTRVDVPIRINGNTGICGAALTISYDSALKLTGISTGEALSTLTMTKPGDMNANPINLVWDGLDEDGTNGIIATLTFTAPATTGDYSVSVSYDNGDIVDGNLNAIQATVNNGKVTVADSLHKTATVTVGSQTVTLVNTTDYEGKIITAFYKTDGTLIKVDRFNRTESAIQPDMPINAKYAKIMWWDGIEGLKPLCNAENLNF